MKEKVKSTRTGQQWSVADAKSVRQLQLQNWPTVNRLERTAGGFLRSSRNGGPTMHGNRPLRLGASFAPRLSDCPKTLCFTCARPRDFWKRRTGSTKDLRNDDLSNSAVDGRCARLRSWGPLLRNSFGGKRSAMA